MTQAPITEPTLEEMEQRLAAARAALPMWVDHKKDWPTLRMQPTLRTNFPDVGLYDLDDEEPHAIPHNLHDEDLHLAVMRFLEISAGATARAIRLEKLVGKLQAALSWLQEPLVDHTTSPEELRKRVQFCLEDARRALTEATPTINQEGTTTMPSTNEAALKAALAELAHAASGFAEEVRRDSGLEYPFPPLDAAMAKARALTEATPND